MNTNRGGRASGKGKGRKTKGSTAELLPREGKNLHTCCLVEPMCVATQLPVRRPISKSTRPRAQHPLECPQHNIRRTSPTGERDKKEKQMMQEQPPSRAPNKW